MAIALRQLTFSPVTASDISLLFLLSRQSFIGRKLMDLSSCEGLLSRLCCDPSRSATPKRTSRRAQAFRNCESRVNFLLTVGFLRAVLHVVELSTTALLHDAQQQLLHRSFLRRHLLELEHIVTKHRTSQKRRVNEHDRDVYKINNVIRRRNKCVGFQRLGRGYGMNWAGSSRYGRGSASETEKSKRFRLV